MGLITIATDFGGSDGYTGAMCGVIKSIAPGCEIVHICDGLSSIIKASLVLFRYYSHFPKGTVHLVVIDPTVGSGRRPLAGSDGSHFFVGPDNGVFSRVIDDRPSTSWFEIAPHSLPGRFISSTFHGRDIFAPAAALLSAGKQLSDLGKPLSDPVLIELPVPIIRGDGIQGEIIDIDGFGNLITNIKDRLLAGRPSVHFPGSSRMKFAKTFSDVPPGSPVAYIGSLGLLEIAVNLGRADRFFSVGVGSKVEVEL